MVIFIIRKKDNRVYPRFGFQHNPLCYAYVMCAFANIICEPHMTQITEN